MITWTAIAVDPDGDEISYKFLANDKEAGDWSSSNFWVWDTSSAVPGEYNIKVLARDGKHASEDSFDSSMEANLAITASNQPPALISLKPDKSSPQVQGATVSWTAKAGTQRATKSSTNSSSTAGIWAGGPSLPSGNGPAGIWPPEIIESGF